MGRAPALVPLQWVALVLFLGLALPGHSLAAPGANPPVQIDSYPRDGDTHIPVNAELHFVFDQPTFKRGSFSVADFDSGSGTLLLLDSPRWSALGDTVFLKPTYPMEYGHLHGMRVNTIFGGTPPDTVASDLQIVYFKTFPRATLEAIPSGDALQSMTLVPELPTPVETSVREIAGNAVTFTQARVELWTDPSVVLSGPGEPEPAFTTTLPVFAQVPRRGSARLSVPVTVPRYVARSAPDGQLGLRIVYEGMDETGLPLSFAAFSMTVTTVFADTILTMSPVLLTPEIGGNAIIRSAVLEWPLPGAAFSAGDTLRPRAVVIGSGTGPFRAAFYMDGEVVAMEEGYMESGRPAVVETRGPLPTRRLGEHRLQFVVEAPQNVASEPITFLALPPVSGLTPAGPDAAPAEPDTALRRLQVESTWLADARTRFREERGSVVGWLAWRARYDLSPGPGSERTLEARVTSRVRADEPRNGTVSPNQLLLRYSQKGAAVEWGDLAPALASAAPLLASPVPRRGAQASWTAASVGTLEGYVALESKPRSSGGLVREARSDLYAARLSRGFGSERLKVSIYGGYTHEDPTPEGLETRTRSRAIYGGSTTLSLLRDWTFLADAASVRHRTIEGVEAGRTRTGVRGELSGSAARVLVHAQAFRFQPDLRTALNPYALSDRKGFAVDATRLIAVWRFFGGYRRESPEDETSGAPEVTVERITGGAVLRLNRGSSVTPSLVRIRQKGIQTDFTQTRIATEFTAAEQLGGRTTARFDVGSFRDEKGLNTRHRVFSGSVVSARRHAGRVASTISAGFEHDRNDDFDVRDFTFQGALEARWEALPSRLLVSPFVSYLSRDYELRGFKEDRLGGRLQISLLRLPGLGDAALSVQGRLERIWFREPLGTRDTEGAFEVSLGKRVPIFP